MNHESIKYDRLSSLIWKFQTRIRLIGNDERSQEGPGSEDGANLYLSPYRLINQSVLNRYDLELPKENDENLCLLFFLRGMKPAVNPIINDPLATAVCFYVDLGIAGKPIELSMPKSFALNLNVDPEFEAIGRIICREVHEEFCGGAAIINRLFDALMIHMLREVIKSGITRTGLLAGLGHPNLYKALVAMHEQPERNWSIEDLASLSCLSRTGFSTKFREIVGQTPAKYLKAWRLTLARIELEKGLALKQVAGKFGFSSDASLCRAIKLHYDQ